MNGYCLINPLSIVVYTSWPCMLIPSCPVFHHWFHNLCNFSFISCTKRKLAAGHDVYGIFYNEVNAMMFWICFLPLYMFKCCGRLAADADIYKERTHVK